MLFFSAVTQMVTAYCCLTIYIGNLSLTFSNLEPSYTVPQIRTVLSVLCLRTSSYLFNFTVSALISMLLLICLLLFDYLFKTIF